VQLLPRESIFVLRHRSVPLLRVTSARGFFNNTTGHQPEALPVLNTPSIYAQRLWSHIGGLTSPGILTFGAVAGSIAGQQLPQALATCRGRFSKTSFEIPKGSIKYCEPERHRLSLHCGVGCCPAQGVKPQQYQADVGKWWNGSGTPSQRAGGGKR